MAYARFRIIRSSRKIEQMAPQWMDGWGIWCPELENGSNDEIEEKGGAHEDLVRLGGSTGQ